MDPRDVVPGLRTAVYVGRSPELVAALVALAPRDAQLGGAGPILASRRKWLPALARLGDAQKRERHGFWWRAATDGETRVSRRTMHDAARAVALRDLDRLPNAAVASLHPSASAFCVAVRAKGVPPDLARLAWEFVAGRDGGALPPPTREGRPSGGGSGSIAQLAARAVYPQRLP